VVAKERGRQEALLRDISQLDVQLAKLAELD
jgi:hypothetical protein